MDCLYRTNIGASATVGAYLRINFVDITFRNSFNRTFIDAGSAGSAIIINFICHDLLNLCPAMQGWVNNAIFNAKIKHFLNIVLSLLRKVSSSRPEPS